MLYTERAMGVKCEQSQMRTLYNVRELLVFSVSKANNFVSIRPTGSHS